MPETTGRAQRNAANTAAIVVGAVLVALSMWGGSAVGVSETGESRAQVPWLVHFSAGALAIAGVLIAQRWRRRRLGQAALLIGAAILIGALVMFRYFGPWAWLTFVLPAVVLLAATPFLAPMPAPTGSKVPDSPTRADNLP
jgi:predicted MFS family arabinose efflux permease